MKPEYTIERWPFGWLLCAPEANSGIPSSALNESAKLFPKGAVIDTGIAHHFRASGNRKVVACIAGIKEAKQWRAAILEEIAGLTAAERWWKGLDVGTSSAAIFSVFCDKPQLAYEAKDFSQGSTPRDGDDFGRCQRLVDSMPGWNEQLQKVAEAYPDTKWPQIIARWAELAAATPDRQTEILGGI